MSQIPAVMLEAARNERRRLVQVRDEAEAKIAELDAYLATMGLKNNRRGRVANPNSLAGQIKAVASEMIVPGRYVSTQQIYEELVRRGVKFPEQGKAPRERISNEIGKNAMYVANRAKGWSLKGETPGGTGVSSATTSVEDE